MTPLLDAHLHFWDPAARHHGWLTAHPPLRRRFGPEDLAPGAHELTGAVFVQADCRDTKALGEVRWVTDLACVAVFCELTRIRPGQALNPGLGVRSATK